jgi:hypothetical protein
MAHPAPTPAPAYAPAPAQAPAHAPFYPRPIYGACTSCGQGHHGYFDGGCCQDTCDCEQPSFFERLCARFRRSHDDCCETTCDTCDTCDTCCDDHHRGGLFSRFRHHNNDCCEDTCDHGGDCGCATECDCGCDRPSFFERLRARFHRSHDCCEDICDCAPCCDHPFPGHAVKPAPKKPAEKIPAPKGAGTGDKEKGKAGDKGKAGEKPVGKLPIGTPGASIPEVIPSPTTVREPF